MNHPAEQLGFVSLDDIQNTFVVEFLEIENDFKRNGCPTDPKVFMDHMDHIRLRLIQKAQYNMSEYLKRNPEVRAELSKKKTEEPTQDNSKWQDRVKKNREAAIQDAYK